MARSGGPPRGGANRRSKGGPGKGGAGKGGAGRGGAGTGGTGRGGAGKGGAGRAGGRSGSGAGPGKGRGQSAQRSGASAPSRSGGRNKRRDDRAGQQERGDRESDRRRGTDGPGPGTAPKGLGGDQVEGRQAVRELLMTQSRRIGEVLLASDLDPAPILEDIRDLADQTRVPIVEVTRGKLDTVARSEAPQGVIARADQLKNHTLDELLTPQDGRAPFLLVLDHVTDPGNLGAILRTAECAGVTGVVLPKHRAARISPSVTKAAAGAIEHLRIGQVGGVARTLLELTKAEVWTIGLDASGATLLHDLQVPDGPIALVLGAEQSGLSRLVAERCDLLTRIPIVGNTESLNVSAAAAIATYHLANTR